ncbi:MAG: hypothetical protein AB7V56_13805 [Candidatus Nitrosocosmicus sp.]
MSEATELSEKRRRKIIHYKTALESFKVELRDFEGNKKDKILELAKLLEETGHPKETISERVGDDLAGYLSKQYVRKVLSDEYKDPKQVRNQAQNVPLNVGERATSSAIVTNKENLQQPIIVTNTGTHEFDYIYGKSREQMRHEAEAYEEMKEDEEGTSENPLNILRTISNPPKESIAQTNKMISDTLTENRHLKARVIEVEEALRIQKEEADSKGKRCIEYKRQLKQNSLENVQRRIEEYERTIRNLKTIQTNYDDQTVKEELGYKEIEIFKLNTLRVSWLLQTSKTSERTLFLLVNPKSMEIVEVKTDKEMHRIQSRRRQEAELISE